MKDNPRKNITLMVTLIILIILFVLKPYAIIYGVQRGSLYALVAIPLALTLGIVGILNLAHGDFLTLGAYLSYWFFTSLGLDPTVSIVLIVPLMFAIGAGLYKLTISRVLKAPLLNQLLLTFGL
ncbi:MAG: branched-chain amino acid ABC transporter permease, partial [Thermotoga sp.]